MTNGLAYSFDQALVWLRGGRKITRRGWNGKGMYMYLVREGQVTVGNERDTDPLVSLLGEGAIINYADRIDMHYADSTYGAWTATHNDILANDWNLLV